MSLINRIDLLELNNSFEVQNEIDDFQDINLDSYLIDPDIEVAPPIPILSINQYGTDFLVFTEDNISLIQGKAKSRKSTLIKAIGISILKGKINFEHSADYIHSNYNRNNIAIFDTEQSKYHCYKTVKTIKIITNKKMNYFNIAEENAKKKKRIIEKYLKFNPNCGFIVIDNIVHLVKNYNDAEECSELSEWLIQMKSKYNCHICCVLHENGSDTGNGKAKGHIGTLLENIAEIIIRTEKDREDKSKSIISVKESRELGFEDFCIERDTQGTPYLFEYDRYSNKKSKI